MGRWTINGGPWANVSTGHGPSRQTLEDEMSDLRENAWTPPPRPSIERPASRGVRDRAQTPVSDTRRQRRGPRASSATGTSPSPTAARGRTGMRWRGLAPPGWMDQHSGSKGADVEWQFGTGRKFPGPMQGVPSATGVLTSVADGPTVRNLMKLGPGRKTASSHGHSVVIRSLSRDAIYQALGRKPPERPISRSGSRAEASARPGRVRIRSGDTAPQEANQPGSPGAGSPKGPEPLIGARYTVKECLEMAPAPDKDKEKLLWHSKAVMTCADIEFDDYVPAMSPGDELVPGYMPDMRKLDTPYLSSLTGFDAQVLGKLYIVYCRKVLDLQNKMSPGKFRAFCRDASFAADKPAVCSRVFKVCDLSRNGAITFVQMLQGMRFFLFQPDQPPAYQNEQFIEYLIRFIDPGSSGEISALKICEAIRGFEDNKEVATALAECIFENISEALSMVTYHDFRMAMAAQPPVCDMLHAVMLQQGPAAGTPQYEKLHTRMMQLTDFPRWQRDREQGRSRACEVLLRQFPVEQWKDLLGRMEAIFDARGGVGSHGFMVYTKIINILITEGWNKVLEDRSDTIQRLKAQEEDTARNIAEFANRPRMELRLRILNVLCEIVNAQIAR